MTYMRNYVEYLADTELKRANGLHPAFASAHEGWAVLLEEIRELSSETHAIEDMHQLAFADVMQDRSACDGITCVYETAIRAACEAIQVAAMAKSISQWRRASMSKHYGKHLSCTVSPQTLWHLRRLARMSGYGDQIGRVVDKLTREKVLELKPKRGYYDECTGHFRD